MKLLLLGHLAITWSLIGLIWLIQVVHYPLFAQVGTAAFPNYEAMHIQRITLVVLPLMLTELVTGLMLALRPPTAHSTLIYWGCFALIIVIWLLTAVVNIPQHSALSAGFDLAVHRALVLSNWFRTIAWTIRGLVILWLAASL